MSDVLNGDPDHVTTPLTRSVSSLSNNGSGAVRVTTSAPHLYGPGDTVLMATSVVSGLYAITVIDADHFDLIGSTFTSTSTGAVTDLSLTPQVQVPTDADPGSVQLSGLLSALQALLDRDQFLNQLITNLAAASSSMASYTFTSSSVTPAVLAVTSLGAPAVLETSPAHGLQSGMWVNVAGATGDTVINGNWPVQVVDATHFSIPVQASGTYTASSATVTPIVPPGVNWLVVDGWGGGGGGEGGGGLTSIADASGGFFVPLVQGGGGQGAPRTTSPLPTTPLTALSWIVGNGGPGGTGATGATGATAGTNGGVSSVTNGSRTVVLNAGVGAGTGQTYPNTVPTGTAIIAPGGQLRAGIHKPWPFASLPEYLFTASLSNVANFLPQGEGDGGAAVVPARSGSMPNPSTNGIGQNGGGGGAAGANGTDSGSSPTYKGGAGGGGGGAGPLGAAAPGGTGGDGTNGNHSGNSTTGGSATSFSGTNTGAGGGGGGTAGAASGTTAGGGAGATGDSGQLTLYVPAYSSEAV